ncbi:MAG TPA: S26 family signal peptidase, partial [Humisphaera sp.]
MTVDGPADQPTPAPRPAPPPPPGVEAADGGEAAPAAAKKHHPEGNFKDTIESILVAFILAFVFRAFVVEAFVIPTGSMAPTLLGAHTRFTCADCGYGYTVNYSTRSVGGDIQIDPKAPGGLNDRVFCPNCGYPVPQQSNQEPDRTDVPVHYGDRILVLKYRYLLAGPRRWDVVVFKTPDTVENATPYTTNYIKRLVGLPGETVMLLDGDVYVSPAPPLDHATLVAGLRSIVQDPTVPPAAGPDADAAKAAREYLATFRIQRKPGYAQDAVWRTVHDNDYVPHLPAARRKDDYGKPAQAWVQPWEPVAGGSGWDVG